MEGGREDSPRCRGRIQEEPSVLRRRRNAKVAAKTMQGPRSACREVGIRCPLCMRGRRAEPPGARRLRPLNPRPTSNRKNKSRKGTASLNDDDGAFCSPVGGANAPSDANVQIVRRTGEGVVAPDNMAWRQVQPLFFLIFSFCKYLEWPGEGQGQALCIRISKSKAPPSPNKSLFRFISGDLLTLSCLNSRLERYFVK